MTRMEAIEDLLRHYTGESTDMAIEALKREPCESEIILTKEEYGQLLSNEFDNGYTKGYTEALEQNDVLADFINQCKIEDAIINPEGATNGDMIKAMFPNVECREDELGNVFIVSSAQLGYIALRECWWNAPYKG